MEGDALAGLDPRVVAAAAAAGIDVQFLSALPPALRAEVLAGAGIAPAPPAQAAAPTPLAAPAAPPAAAPAAPDAAPEAAPAAPEAAPAPAAAPEEEEEEAEPEVDPEFLAALPLELQAEVLEQQRRERRLRAAAAARRRRERAGGAAPAGPAERDFAALLSSFPPDVRDEALAR